MNPSAWNIGNERDEKPRSIEQEVQAACGPSNIDHAFTSTHNDDIVMRVQEMRIVVPAARDDSTSSTSSYTPSTPRAGFCSDVISEKKEKMLRQFIILGVSHFIEEELVVRFMNILGHILDEGKVERVVQIIEEISTGGKCANQDAVLLCLVKCYTHSDVAKRAVTDIAINVCRIPTQLFKFLYILEKENKTTDNNSPEHYRELLRSLGTNAEKCRNMKRLVKKDLESRKSERNKFVSKHKKFVTKWYTDPKKTAEDLLMLLTKYPKRYGWDHKILLRLSHPKIKDDDKDKLQKDIVLKYHLYGQKKIEPFLDQFISDVENKVLIQENSNRIFKYIQVFAEMKRYDPEDEGTPSKVASVVRESIRHEKLGVDIPYSHISYIHVSSKLPEMIYPKNTGKRGRLHLTIELLPAALKKSKEVWNELIKDLPMTALMKHLSHMSRIGLFEMQENVECVQRALTDPRRLYPFIHPISILKALVVYSRGEARHEHKGVRESWRVHPQIVAILNDAFHMCLMRKEDGSEKDISFNNCVICIDMSKTMTMRGFLGFDMFSASMISVAIATTIERNGDNIRIYACGSEMHLLNAYPINCNTSMLERFREICGYYSVTVDMSLPIKNAIRHKLAVDSFIIFTKSSRDSFDSNTLCDAYLQYKELMPNTKMVVCSMEANYQYIAEKKGCNGITVCGADADVLREISNGIQGN